RAEFGLDGEGVAGVVDGRGDLAAVADDAGIEQQAFDVGLVHGGDARNVETVEDLAEALALPEDGQPGEPRLEAFEAELLEQPRVVDHRPSPLPVVIV